MALSGSTDVPSSYSDKQVVSSFDHGKEVVATHQPYPDAYAYANPNNTNNDSSKGGAGGGGLEAVDHLLTGNEGRPAWSEQEPKRRIFGLSRRSLIILIAVVTALVVAAIIGGSVGGVLASKSSSGSPQADAVSASGTFSAVPQPTSAAVTTAPAGTTTSEPLTSTDTPSPSSSSSKSTTGSSATATPTSGEGTYNCPADDNTSYTSSLSSTQIFTILCDTDWPSGVTGFDSGTVTDLTAVVAYSIDACIDQCAAYNIAGGSCGAVVYGANITLALSRGGIQGNCFLKDQRGAKNTADNSGQVEAAYLSTSS